MPSSSAPRLSIRGLKSPLAGPFDMELAAGECLVIDGASGSGKSLFLRMIADLDPSEGEVRLDGAPRENLSGPAWRRQVPYVAADSGWWADEVATHFAPETHGAARDLAERFGLPAELFDALVSRLSTGERQRLAIIRGLVLEAPVLLLDEPTAPLDPAATKQVETVLRERLSGGTSIVLVSHDARQAGRLKARRRTMHERRLEPAQ